MDSNFENGQEEVGFWTRGNCRVKGNACVSFGNPVQLRSQSKKENCDKICWQLRSIKSHQLSQNHCWWWLNAKDKPLRKFFYDLEKDLKSHLILYVHAGSSCRVTWAVAVLSTPAGRSRCSLRGRRWDTEELKECVACWNDFVLAQIVCITWERHASLLCSNQWPVWPQRGVLE